MEADLGIDTVKQAEILGEVREHFGLEPDESFRLSDYPTIESLLGWLQSQGGQPSAPSKASTVVPAAVTVPSEVVPANEQQAPTSESGAGAAMSADAGAVTDVLLGIISEKTGYETDELDLDFELEADLGIDTVKQAEIFGEVREHFGIQQDENFRLSDYPTIESLIGWIAERVAEGAGVVQTTPSVAMDEGPTSRVDAVDDESSTPDALPANHPYRMLLQ